MSTQMVPLFGVEKFSAPGALSLERCFNWGECEWALHYSLLNYDFSYIIIIMSNVVLYILYGAI